LDNVNIVIEQLNIFQNNISLFELV
jgi:hypothetical protein